MPASLNLHCCCRLQWQALWALHPSALYSAAALHAAAEVAQELKLTEQVLLQLTVQVTLQLSLQLALQLAAQLALKLAEQVMTLLTPQGLLQLTVPKIPLQLAEQVLLQLAAHASAQLLVQLIGQCQPLSAQLAVQVLVSLPMQLLGAQLAMSCLT